MNLWKTMLCLALVAAALAGCSTETRSSAAASEPTPVPGVYTSPVLGNDYQDALPASSQLALGTLELEGTENAVTPEQAKELLPLWQAIQSGALKSDLETNAVLSQIELAMSEQQVKAIAAMQLTATDMQAYFQERGMPAGMPAGMAAGQGAQAGQPPAGGFGGTLTEEQRSAMRATAEAGGMPAGGPGGGANREQFAAMRATAEASGTSFPGAPGGRAGMGSQGAGQVTLLTAPLMELLTQRAVE